MKQKKTLRKNRKIKALIKNANPGIFKPKTKLEKAASFVIDEYMQDLIDKRSRPVTRT